MTTVQRGTRIGRDDLQVLWFGLLALLISWSVWLPLVLNGPASGHAAEYLSPSIGESGASSRRLRANRHLRRQAWDCDS